MEEVMQQSGQPPRQVEVYGVDHSPWVQAVLLGLHEAGVEHRLQALPPRERFLATGVRMPSASLDGGRWKLESTDILIELGYREISQDERRLVLGTWQGVLGRTDSAALFWGGFSLAGDTHSSAPRRLIRNFLRSFITLYMYVLIRTLNWMKRRPKTENHGDQYVPVVELLDAGAGPFIGGDAPDSLDLLLFGIIQCHCSVYVEPVTALQSDPRLAAVRDWIGAMQMRFADYPHLYSGLYFAPHSPPPVWAAPADRIAFWLGSLCMIGLFPVTVPLVGILYFLTQKNLARR